MSMQILRLQICGSNEDLDANHGNYRHPLQRLRQCGSVADPDPVGSVYYWLSWIRIRILYTDPDPYIVTVLDPDPYIEYTDPQH